MLNAWKNQDLKKKMLFTLFVVIIFRIGSVIPVPFMNISALQSLMGSLEDGSLFTYFNTISGDAFSRATLFAMSITPYINSSIIMQLMTVVIPALERLTKEGEEGRKKMSAITRYLTVTLGLLQGTMFYFWLKNNRAPSGERIIMYNDGWESIFAAVVIIMTFTAGTALIMWLGEQINQKGVGNGISILFQDASIGSNFVAVHRYGNKTSGGCMDLLYLCTGFCDCIFGRNVVHSVYE